MSVKITVLAPGDWLNSNHRLHRMPQAQLTKLWRNAARKAAGNIERINR